MVDHQPGLRRRGDAAGEWAGPGLDVKGCHADLEYLQCSSPLCRYVSLRSEWIERFRDPALTDAAAVANSGGIGFCVGLVDLDRFKQIHDERGHAQGDTLLHDFAQTATRRLRASDVLGRWGGEEFLIVFPGTAPDGAARIVERLQAALREIPIAGCLVTLSAGISAYIDRAKTRTLPSPGTMRPCMPPITVGATR